MCRMQNYFGSLKHKVDVARYVIHNHIIRIDSNESIMKDVTREI